MTLTLGDVVAVLVSQGYAAVIAIIMLFLLWLTGGFFIPDTPLSFQFFGCYLIADTHLLLAVYYAETHPKKKTTS